MKTTHTTKTLRLLAGAIIASVAVVASCPGAAFADVPTGSVTAKFVAEAPGYAAAYDGKTNAIPQQMQIENGDTVVAYCVDLPKSFNDSATFVGAKRSKLTSSNLDKAAWIAVNSATVGTPLSQAPDNDPRMEAVAVQMAVWNLTNNLDIAPSHFGAYPEISTRAQALVAAAQSLPETPSSFVLGISSAAPGTDGNAVVTATLTTTDGDPIAGGAVTFTDGAATTQGVTDATGKVSTSIKAATGDTVKATFNGKLAAGSILNPTDGTQPLVTVSDAKIIRTATTTVAAAGGTTNTTTPAKVLPETPTTVATSPTTVIQKLPYTGQSAIENPVILGGLGLLLLAGIGGLIRHRRNSTIS